MSRTKKGGKGAGSEYWKGRPNSHLTPLGKPTKVITHKIERRKAKRGLRKLINDIVQGI